MVRVGGASVWMFGVSIVLILSKYDALRRQPGRNRRTALSEVWRHPYAAAAGTTGTAPVEVRGMRLCLVAGRTRAGAGAQADETMTDQITHIPTDALQSSPYQYRRCSPTKTWPNWWRRSKSTASCSRCWRGR